MPDSIPVVDQPLFFLDYDGTLAPIVDDPMQAFAHPDVEGLLEALEEEHPVWIITGRFLRDLTVFIKRPLPAIGLHGMQEGTIGGDVRSTVPEEAGRAIASLRETVPVMDGIRLEDKGPTFAVHYRGVADEQVARRELRAWMEGASELLDPIWGKKVVEVRPRGVHKGVAVQRIAAEHPDRTPLYLGDDVTDEDAFRALGEDAITVKVGEGETSARFRLPDVPSVVAYLQQYVDRA